MSGCTTNKFVINKSLKNEYTLVIKQQGSMLPMEITANDSFIMRLYELGTDTLIATITETPDANGSISAPAGLTGKITITLNEALTITLKSEKGSKADRYYVKPMYRASIDCVTTNNGNFTAKIPLIYVE